MTNSFHVDRLVQNYSLQLLFFEGVSIVLHKAIKLFFCKLTILTIFYHFEKITLSNCSIICAY